MALKVKKASSKESKNSSDLVEGSDNGLMSFIADLNKIRGSGTVVIGNQFHESCEFVSTGNSEIDWALGGGIPLGRMVEIYGPESSGKTTLCLTTAREYQLKGHNVAFVDVEQAVDMTYARKLGVNVDMLAICQPSSGEQALNVANDLLKSGKFGLVIIDSIAALVTQAELEGDIGKASMGQQARLMSSSLKQLIISASNAGCTVMFTNQMRMKIGVMFGNPETTPGGEAMKFYATQRIEMRKSTRITDGDVVIGQDTKIKIVKNKVAAPFREVNVPIIYGEGFDDMSSLVNMAEKAGALTKSGAWYSYNGKNIAQGKEKMRDLLLNDLELKAELSKIVRESSAA